MLGVEVREYFPEEVAVESLNPGVVRRRGRPSSKGDCGLRRGGGAESHTVCLPQLCCLHADMLGSLGPKEAKKAFLDFYHSFLEKTAVRDLQAAPTPQSLFGPAESP